MSQGTRVTITPFNLPPLDTGPQTDLPEQLVHRSSSPPPLRGVVSVPVCLSSKELARLRSLANESRSQPVDRQPSNSPLTTTIDRDVPEGAAGAATSSSEVRILSEANVLWDETRLHAEISEPPPSYASGAAPFVFIEYVLFMLITTKNVSFFRHPAVLPLSRPSFEHFEYLT